HLSLTMRPNLLNRSFHLPRLLPAVGQFSAVHIGQCIRRGAQLANKWERGIFHIELEGQPAHVDAPLVYMDHHLLVTPLSQRLRASSFMEFSGLQSAPDPRKPARLRKDMQSLGYTCAATGPSWRGARPVLPDYLP